MINYYTTYVNTALLRDLSHICYSLREMTQTTAPATTPSPTGGNSKHTAPTARDYRSEFFMTVWQMTWQLALVIFISVFIGIWLDKQFDTGQAFTILSLLVAGLGATLVLWRIIRRVNKLPTPKLTAAQRRKVQQQYEEDDD